MSGLYDPDRAYQYVQALKREISTLNNRHPLETLYIGGGTPTMLPVELLKDLISHIFDHFNFSSTYEATIEANPGTIDSIKLTALSLCGMNRVSLGVQSFDQGLLEFLGRIHSAEEAEQAFTLVRDRGFRNIGLDLIYGIPGQTLDMWKETLNRTVQLEPEHVSIYEITYEKGTALHEMMKDTKEHSAPDTSVHVEGMHMLHPPSEDEIIAMYEYAITYLTSKGFSHYEISNFALPGSECRHNLNYWDRGDYYGAGLGAHSFTDSRRFFNVIDMNRYIDMLLGNQSPVDAIEEIPPDMSLSETLFLGLRKTGGISLEMLGKSFGRYMKEDFNETIESLKNDGLLEIVDSDCSYERVLRLTSKGQLLSNEVFVKFL